MDILKRSTSKLLTKQATQREALARQNARSDRVCLDFSLVTFFASRQRKWQMFFWFQYLLYKEDKRKNNINWKRISFQNQFL